MKTLKQIREFKHSMTFYDVKSAAAAEKKLKTFKLKGNSSSKGGKYKIDVVGKFSDIEKWLDSLPENKEDKSEALKNVYTVSVLFRDEKKAKAFSKDRNLLKLAKVTGIEKTQLRFNKIGWTVDLESENNNIAQNPINKKIEAIKAKYETDVKEASVADDDQKAAAKLNSDLSLIIYEIDKAMSIIDKNLSSFGSPGLKSAFTQAIKSGLRKTGTFDIKTANNILKGYYKR